MERGSPALHLCNNINFVNFTLIDYPPVLKDTTEQRHRSVRRSMTIGGRRLSATDCGQILSLVPTIDIAVRSDCDMSPRGEVTRGSDSSVTLRVSTIIYLASCGTQTTATTLLISLSAEREMCHGHDPTRN